MLDEFAIRPEHQFGFRRAHGTPEQCHRIINEILSAFESKNTALQHYLTFNKRLIESGMTAYYIKSKSGHLHHIFYY